MNTQEENPPTGTQSDKELSSEAAENETAENQHQANSSDMDNPDEEGIIPAEQTENGLDEEDLDTDDLNENEEQSMG